MLGVSTGDVASTTQERLSCEEQQHVVWGGLDYVEPNHSIVDMLEAEEQWRLHCRSFRP